MATTYTPRLGLGKLGLDDPFDISQINANMDLIDQGVQDTMSGRAAHNLLDNSWFVDPVNQMGQTSYTGAGYTIDRWRQSNAYSTVDIGSGYVRFSASGGSAYPRQYVLFKPGMYGKVYTAAICTTDGKITTVSATVSADAVEQEVILATATIAEGALLRMTKSTGDRISVRFDLSDGASISLRWAALYEGAYTKDTLPDYTPKGYASELYACLQHFRRWLAEETYRTIGMGMATSATQAWINVPRTRMRITKPTVRISGMPRINMGNTAINATAITVDKISDSYIRFLATASGMTPGACLVADNGATTGFYIDEDANL